jgi:hypothetical protein
VGQPVAQVRRTCLPLEQQLGPPESAMLIRLAVLTLAAVAATSCERGAPEPPPVRPRHPLLDGLNPPPLNRPLTSVGVVPLGGTPALPGGTVPALVLVSDGRAVEVRGSFSAPLAMKEGRLELSPIGRPAIHVLYRLPDGLTLPVGSSSVGRFVRFAGSWGRRTLLRSEGSLLLAELVVRAPTPVSLDLGDGLKIVQRPASASRAGEATDVQADAMDDERPVGTLASGAATSVRTRSGTFNIFIVSSRLAKSEERPGGYVLDAWVARSSD